MTTSMNGKRVEKGERGQNASSWLKDDERYFSSPSQRQEVSLRIYHAPEDYVAACYRKTTFMATYSHIIMPSNGPKQWPIIDNRLIPKGGNKKQKSKKKSQAGESSQAPQPQGSQAPTVLSQGSQAPKASQMPSQHS
ncbi:hypothetical protein P8452_14691 [Trifolium repens]|nr:hypothetical protein P8452_14691 [Trifolium repens]